ncbi:NADH-quinone oxidoreductase subunit L [Aliarcobacter cibarius]|uniref:NADH-quinone oxidoreductase subunit L n=1 Tax=Aliarcobacter cibarius TaxID=255507 RepID=A0ABY2V5Y4_9BACT|nr:NADH-quinone oxidoreductase subunit L [Aliarcobacter cibarius]QEZ89788.1 NADH:quinone oxidoreductase I, membrane subunit L [Aliarcobacter cibarius]TLT01053.1 NADH-quinone oxidoreductase subunit L [Aliarcobacter cibarius]TLT01150.1 NADH-quinone oxidoreductase subunit L [Aliarcobacter cibarius]
MSTNLLIWIILSPLIGAILNGALYFYNIKKRNIGELPFAFIGTLTPLISFLITLSLFLKMLEEKIIFKQHIFTWLNISSLNVDMAFLGDNLAIFMSMFVTFVGWLIHIYAVGYMKGDEGFGKFFAYFNLFLASMLILVLADNPVILFIGWEGVGVCSYLLIKFYYGDKNNVLAANKAFIVNRVGDFGFLLGIATLFFALGQVDLSFSSIEANLGNTTNGWLLLAGFLLFVGAMGKSAQIPLYTWLPDAMAGPTPISALIHAATMVTAGVYMVARFHFLYSGIEEIGTFIAYIGAFSALLAAIIATRQTDIKKILAYSTMSQLGYMFIAVGLGFYSTGLFHVFTHAFFKAMLFMGAGGVILAIHHEQNIFNIAKHRASLPIISTTFLIGVIAISGIPPFSGFFSKDAILAAAFQEGHYLIYGIALFTAFLTAFYMFRLYFIVFVTPNHHKKEYVYTSMTITIPLLILAIGAIGAGFLNFPSIFGGSHMVDSFLGSLNSKTITISHNTEYILMALSVLVASLGIFVAYKKYANFDLEKPELEVGFIGRKLYVDELYDLIFVRGLKSISKLFDKVIDDKIIDDTIMRISTGFVNVGKRVATIQNANVRFYAVFMLLGMTFAFIYLYISLGL